MSDKLISIVVPMYFEEEVAEECYKRLSAVASVNSLNYELIFVNDGSTDKTLDILEAIANQDLRVKVVSFSRNFGHQIAVTAGIDKAKGDAIVIIDADLQDPPELIPDMIKLWESGYEVVYGKRKKRDGESFFKLFTANMFYRTLNKLSSVAIPMDTGDFRLIDRKVVDVLKRMPEKNRFLRGMSSWVGFKQIPLEYERKERFAGETKYPLKKMLKFAMDGIISFSSKPIKFVEYIGTGTILIALSILLYFLLGTAAGYSSISLRWVLIITLIAFLGGLQLLAIGIIGEYITRIYDESKGRPLYIISKELNLEKGIGHPVYAIGKDLNSDKKLTRLYVVGKEADNNQQFDAK